MSEVLLVPWQDAPGPAVQIRRPLYAKMLLIAGTG